MNSTILFAAAAAALINPTQANAVTPAETAALESVPAHIRPACVPVPAAWPATALLTCDLTATDGVIVTYQRFATHSDASDGYTSATDPAIAESTRRDGDCAAGIGPTERTFSRGTGIAGRVACWTGAGGATIAWLDTDTGTVATATRTDGNLAALGAWWTQAGPEAGAETETTDMGGVFPDPYERPLLRDLPSGATGCVRLSGLTRSEDGAQAGVACHARSAGAVGFLRLASGAHVHRVYRLMLMSFDVRHRSGGACSGRSTERAFRTSAGTAGRFMCVVSRGRAYLVWKDPHTRTLGVLISKGPHMKPLFTWWREHGRTLGAVETTR